jgi:two-component system, NtrC family, response regulator AtoC
VRKRTLYLVDDERDQIDLLTAQLERSGAFATEAFIDPREALERILSDPPDGVICDLLMPEMDGLEFTRRLRESHPFIPIIIATGKGLEKDASDCFEAGATDFVTKPVNSGTLIARIRKALDEVPAREFLLESARAKFDPHAIVGSHARIEELRAFIDKVAAVPRVSVLILGESGTGKNLVARAIHARGDVASFRFVEVNCAALPANLLEAELFGYEKGAFTDAGQTKKGLVEEADGGTLFLDEVGSLSPELQAKLLTFLESRTFRRVGSTADLTVELRIIAATNTDLEAQVRQGNFREDLYYRLNVASHTLPPLREIRSDVPELILHLVEKAAGYFRKPVPRVDSEEARRLASHDWPGNVRELRNVVERAMTFSQDPVLHFGPDAFRASFPTLDPSPPGEAPGEGSSRGTPSENGGPEIGTAPVIPIASGLTLEAVERAYIRATLEQVDGHVNEAASRLGLSRKVFWARRKKLGLI